MRFSIDPDQAETIVPKLTIHDIDSRINYHPPSERAQQLHQQARGLVRQTMIELNANLPDCRETALVMTKLEEALFWANAAIARNHDRI